MSGKILSVIFALAFCAATALVPTGVAEAQTVIGDGLVVYWSFDAADVNGDTVSGAVGGDDGRLVGGPAVGQGKYGDGLVFDGADDYAEVPEFALGDFTIEVWFKATSAPPMWWRIFDGGLGKAGDMFITPNDPRTGWDIGIAIQIDNVVVGEAGTGVTTVVDQWYHVAVTYDKGGDGIKIYVDGELKGEHVYNEQSFEDWDLPQNWYLAKSNWEADPLFHGIMDELRIYDRALSANEVKQNMTAEGYAVVSPDERLAGTWGEIKRK